MKLYPSMWSSENTDEEDEGIALLIEFTFKTRLATIWSSWQITDHKNRWDYSDSALSPYFILSWNDHIGFE